MVSSGEGRYPRTVSNENKSYDLTQLGREEVYAKDYLNEKKNFLTVSTEEQVRLMYPYVQTSLMQAEISKLQVEVTRYGIKLVEASSSLRKDRYSALAYMNLFIREREKKLKKE